jgi:CheY-like chemotaxis protein
MRQILTNLVGNAVKFTQKGGVIVRVSLVKQDEQQFLRFDVLDTGVGVPVEKRDEIFDEFVQADSTHARRFGGTGLGLAISRRLVEAMGGQIGVEGADGGGSQFWFTVPAIVVSPAIEPGELPLRGLNIAIVARNRVLRTGLTEQVRAAGGNVVARGGKQALRPDMLLVDAGPAALPRLSAGLDRAIPAIALVRSGARSSAQDLIANGFAGYLVKPLRQASLIEQITMRPGSNSAAPQPELHLQAEPASSESPVDPAASGAPRGLKILLAEDNPINSLLTRELLRRRGHHVTDVTSGSAAVSAMEAGSFDILLTDIHMPGMDGIEATKIIRANETASGRRRTPILALTADALVTGMRACKDAGMDGFLTKPIDPAQLDEMLRILFSPSTQLHIAAA